MSIYEKVIVIGHGKIAGEVIEHVYKSQKKYNYSMVYIAHEKTSFKSAVGICGRLHVPYYTIEDEKELTCYFSHAASRCLVISAGNHYLFPEIVTENPNVTIINFHNALLPEFPGRNAPSWAIFENEKETGITWHYVMRQVDAGDIIIQKKCRITPDIRAYELTEKLMRLAYEGFSEKFDEIIENRAMVKRQILPVKRRIYKSTDIPGMCRFNLDDSPEYIYRLLRAVDYGKYNIFPQVTTQHQRKEIRINRYRKVLSNAIEEKAGRLYLPLDEKYLLRLSWSEAG